MKKCDYCGQENGDDTPQCGGCGTTLAPEEGSLESANPDNPARAVAERKIIHGAVWLIGGILVTVITYLKAGEGVRHWLPQNFGSYGLRRPSAVIRSPF